MSNNRLPRRNIRINGRKKLYSHYIWYQYTGHWPVYPDEVVHHIDGDTTNDDFSNLQLMSDSEHRSLHASGENHPFFGKTHTKESKLMNSMSNIERWKDPEFIDKRKAAIKAALNRPEIRAKISAVLMGENNPNWKGDDAKPQSKYMRVWRARRRDE